MRLPFRASALVLMTSLAALAPATNADAQTASAADLSQARELFVQGLELRDAKKDPKAALVKLKAAHALAQTPITGVELGRTYGQLGRLVEAREAFLTVGRLPVLAGESAKATAARQEAASLLEAIGPRIPSLSLKVVGAPEEVISATIDGATIPAAAVSVPRPVDPGDHVVVVTATTGSRAEAKVTLKEGETRTLELNLGAPSASAAASPPAGAATQPVAAATQPREAGDSADEPARGHGLGTRRILGLALGGAGVAALGVGGYFGLQSFSKHSDYSSHCTNNVCDATGVSLHDDAVSAGTLSTVLMGIGAVTLAGGAVLFFTAPRETAPKTAEVKTAWRAAPTVGKGGGGFMVEGTWR